MPRICSAQNCDRDMKNMTHELCDAHYKRLWRHGYIDDTPIAPQRQPALPVIDHADGTRTCAECGERKSRTLEFHADKRSPLGRRKTCKDCRVARETERYQQDPEKHKRRQREFRASNIEHVRAREARYYRENREARIKSAIRHAYIRKDRIASRPRDNGISLKSLEQRHGSTCYFCKTGLDFNKNYPVGGRPDNLATIDHLTPISRGGTHTWENCVLACWRCNATKGTMTEREFVEKMRETVGSLSRIPSPIGGTRPEAHRARL